MRKSSRAFRLSISATFALYVSACGTGSSAPTATSGNPTIPAPAPTPTPTPTPAPTPTLSTNVADWAGSGVLSDVWTPAGFDPAIGTTVIFSHGDKSEPNDNYCDGEILSTAPYNLRVVLPNYGMTEDAQNWQGRRDRWTKQKAVYLAALAQAGSNPSRIVIGGYSFGGYAALLAAGANSDLTGSSAVLPESEFDKQAGNCMAGVCFALAAKGYVVVSAQPAQNALNPTASRFWFNSTAFQSFTAPVRRYVTFGSNDTSPNDACMTAGSLCGAIVTVSSLMGRFKTSSPTSITSISPAREAIGRATPRRRRSARSSTGSEPGLQVSNAANRPRRATERIRTDCCIAIADSGCGGRHVNS